MATYQDEEQEEHEYAGKCSKPPYAREQVKKSNTTGELPF